MAGSPKKRAKREAAQRAKDLLAADGTVSDDPSPTSLSGEDLRVPPQPTTDVSVPLQGEVLPPNPAGTDPTRTALKRAMRARAQEHAEKAIAVLVAALESPDMRIKTAAANDILAWGFGKPATEIEAGDGAQMIVIRRFGEDI